MAALILSLCLLLVKEIFGQSCGQVGPQNRVLDGSPANPCTIPWHVQVHFVPDNTVTPFQLDASTLTCSAVILDRQYVKVSPTCLFLYRTNISQILKGAVLVAGDNDVSVFPETSVLQIQQEQMRVPTEIYFQSEYTIRSQADLLAQANQGIRFKAYRDYQCAIVKLDQPFDFNTCVNSICLPEAEDVECAHKNCIFSGNGLTTTDIRDPTRSSVTQVAALTALPQSVCPTLEAMGYSLPISGGFCAKSESQGAPCINDNGGALACLRNGRYFLRGTAVPDFCNVKAASMFADSASCLDFITQTLNGLSTPAVDP